MSLRSAPSQKSVVAPLEIHKIPSFDASTCPILNVVVYPDKAEVTRRINVTVEEGMSQVRMTNISKCVDPSTIRVLIGGNSILNEVNFTTRSVLDEYAEANGKLDELKVKQTELLKEARTESLMLYRQELTGLDSREHTLKKQKEVLEAFANKLIHSKDAPQDCFDSLSMSSLDMVAKFLPMYEEQSSKITDGLNKIKEQRLELDGKMKEISEEINSTDPTKDGIVSREVQILIEAYDQEDIKLFVSYVVSDAGWVPKYDLRVHSRDKNLKVLYFGLVTQSTGEDWIDAKISLSTASPSTGGLPALGTHELYSRVTNGSIKRSRQGGASVRRKKSEKAIKVPTTESIDEDTVQMTNGNCDGSEENLALDLKEIALEGDHVTTPMIVEGRPAAISTTYGVCGEEVTIPSDKSGHKVHIAKIDLPSAFHYSSCPRVCPHAFLRIVAKNDSAYALLGGSVDVFLDGNFCRKTSIPDVCPTEEFEVDVGSDPTIKVAYRPLVKHKETGSKLHFISYTQDMDLKNGRRENVSILVTDQLPRSSDDKVKVILHEPDVKKKKECNARINGQNNVEWNVEIPAEGTSKIKLRYSVEYPLYMDVTGLI